MIDHGLKQYVGMYQRRRHRRTWLVSAYMVLIGTLCGLGLPYLIGHPPTARDAGQDMPERQVCMERLDRWLYGGTWISRDVADTYQHFTRAMGDCMRGGNEK